MYLVNGNINSRRYKLPAVVDNHVLVTEQQQQQQSMTAENKNPFINPRYIIINLLFPLSKNPLPQVIVQQHGVNMQLEQ
jgi:hypothetical protein